MLPAVTWRIINPVRSLIANLGAAECYKIEHLKSEPIQKVIQQAKVIYSTSFFLTVSPESLVELGKHATTYNKAFMLNVSAEFLVQFFWEQMQTVVPYADFVFANESEGTAYGRKSGWGEDLRVMAKNLSEQPKTNPKRKRTVIITQGPRPTLVYHDGKIAEYPPIECKKEDIVDLNGAGDCFVGGFLAGFVQGKSIDECIAAGHYASNTIIKVSGVKLPRNCDFRFK